MPPNGNKLTYTEICNLATEDVVRYLALRLNDMPEEMARMRSWRDRITGGLVVIGSSAFAALALAVWTRLGL